MNMDGKAQTTPSAGKEKKKREDSRAQTTPPAGKEKEKKEDGRAHTTPPAENEKDSRAQTTPRAGKEKEKKEDGKTPNTPPTGKENEKRKRPLPQPPTDKQQQYSTPQIHIPGHTSSDGQIPSQEPPLPPIGNQKQQIRKDLNFKPPLPPIGNQKQQIRKDLNPKQLKILLETRASSIIMGLKGIIMVAAVVLISSSVEISKAKSCDLETAVKSISLNYTVSCEYDDITKISSTLRDMGIALLTLNILCFLLILLFMLLHPILKVVCIWSLLIGIFSVFMIMKYNDILNSKTSEKDMNYIQLQSAMAIWLQAHYTSDNISSSNEISNSWNTFFIEYDCCAIHQVQGTTNDFDSTPWCTTSGTCQATASQIPRTCCKYVSEDDYGSALSDCHSSVTPGTFRSNCMNVIKQLSVVNVEECQLSLLQMSLIVIATLELVATALEIIAAIIWIILDKQKPKNKDNQPMCDLNKPKSKKEDNIKKVNKKNRNGENKQEK